jgi:hypothetical protein
MVYLHSLGSPKSYELNMKMFGMLLFLPLPRRSSLLVTAEFEFYTDGQTDFHIIFFGKNP